jgi:hypothetical protein
MNATYLPIAAALLALAVATPASAMMLMGGGDANKCFVQLGPGCTCQFGEWWCGWDCGAYVLGICLDGVLGVIFQG